MICLTPSSSRDIVLSTLSPKTARVHLVGQSTMGGGVTTIARLGSKEFLDTVYPLEGGFAVDPMFLMVRSAMIVIQQVNCSCDPLELVAATERLLPEMRNHPCREGTSF